MIAIQTRFIRYFARCFSASGVTSNKVRSCGRSLTCRLGCVEKLGYCYKVSLWVHSKRVQSLRMYQFFSLFVNIINLLVQYQSQHQNMWSVVVFHWFIQYYEKVIAFSYPVCVINHSSSHRLQYYCL